MAAYRLSAIIHLDRPDIAKYHENRSRKLHHYYKTNCKVSGEVHRALCIVSRQTQTTRVSQKADSLPHRRTLTLTSPCQ